MLRAYMLAAVLRKELAEALREKHLRMVLVVGLLFPLLFGWMHVRPESRRSKQTAAAAPADDAVGLGLRDEAPKAVKAFAVVMSVSYGMFLAAIFAITLALESFVGEKERRTMETLLATPATDRELFLSKVLSCFLIATTLGVVFAAVGSLGLAALAGVYDLAVPWGLVGKVWGYSLALLFTVSLTCASLGTIISSRVSTVKAGGQVFGVIMLAVMVAAMVGGFLLEPHGEAVKRTLLLLLDLPRWTLVAVPLLAAVLLNWGLLSLAARTFSREKILTGL